LLEEADRREALSLVFGWFRIERIVFRLNGSALADVVPTGVALHDETLDSGRARGGEKMLCPLHPQLVGHGEPPVEMPHVRLARQGSHLMDDGVRLGAGHGLTDGDAIESIYFDRVDAVGPQLIQLFWVRVVAVT
jgi:hypothetical protein